MHNLLFNNLSLIWQGYHFHPFRLLRMAQEFWKRISKTVLYAEKINHQRVHKGTLFFYWGGTAIENGELDKGFLLIHKALMEDIETHRATTYYDAIPDTPAFKTVTFNFESKENFLFPYLNKLYIYLDNILTKYREDRDSLLQTKDFRNNFLLIYPDVNLLFLFTYLIARLHSLQLYPSYLKNSSFSGLYFMGLLYDILIIINDAIYNRVQTGDKFMDFRDLCVELLLTSGHANHKGKCENDFGHLNVKNVSFNDRLISLLDKKYIFKSKTPNDGFVYDVALAYRIRNHSAHNISSAPVISDRFEDIMKRLFNVLFLTVETFY